MPDLVITITIPASDRAAAIAAVLSRFGREHDDERTDEELVTEVIQTHVGRSLGGWHRKRTARAAAPPPRFGAPEPRATEPEPAPE